MGEKISGFGLMISTLLIVFAVLIGMFVNALSFSSGEKVIVWLGIVILIGSFLIFALREFT